MTVTQLIEVLRIVNERNGDLPIKVDPYISGIPEDNEPSIFIALDDDDKPIYATIGIDDPATELN